MYIYIYIYVYIYIYYTYAHDVVLQAEETSQAQRLV